MEIRFDEESHSYFNEKGYIVPSTTEVLGAVYGTGLEKAPSELVARASKKGTKIHKEIELFLKGEPKEEKELSAETRQFIKAIADKVLTLEPFYKSETILYAKTQNGEVCGTADLFCNGYIYDFKTSKTATRHQIKKWTQQLSFYRYMLEQEGKSVLGAKILHLKADEYKVIDVEYLGADFVEETMKLYSEGKQATQQAEQQQAQTELTTIDKKELAIFADILKRIKLLEASIEPTKNAIKAEMEKRKILALNLGDVSITYIEPSKRKTFDSARFKADNAELYKQYQKESEIKSSIRIKIN